MTLRTSFARLAAVLPLMLIAACGGSEQAPTTGGSGASDISETITLYTCVSDTTIQPVIEAFEDDNPGATIDLFRAPTADLNARVAGDVRSGGLQADVIWACDPLTMQDYVAQDLLGGWTPETEVAEELRTEDYVGVAVLYMVAVSAEGVTPPESWSDLTGDAYADGVVVPDPGFAASALGALGYFSQDPDFGIEYYQALKDNGAVQVSAPDDVTTGVAEGVYKAGITNANSAYAAQNAGSPIEIVWPEPGAIAIYGPAALAADAADSDTAKAFLTYIASEEGQTVIAEAGSYPALEGVSGPTIPEDASIVFPDWAALADQKDDLLADYQQIFGA
ncbi:MAG: extracellular solute-binding protein [Geodermatophilaceae bacterium]|nr:extracellular solute-binding protein [Geodermatophilaceae bacterium]